MEINADHFDRSLPSGFFRDFKLSGRFCWPMSSVESHQVTRHGPALFGDDALLSSHVTSSELSLSLPASSAGMFRVFLFFFKKKGEMPRNVLQVKSHGGGPPDEY